MLNVERSKIKPYQPQNSSFSKNKFKFIVVIKTIYKKLGKYNKSVFYEDILNENILMTHFLSVLEKNTIK